MADSPVQGQQELATDNTEYNQQEFLVRQMLGRLNVATLVQVQAVYPGSNLLVGTIDVLPLVSQVDGADQVTPHGTLYGLPYFRTQGGANAVVCDPVVGDIGFVLFADRDLSSVKTSGAQAPPASGRRFCMADGLYFGGWNINTPPTSYVQVTQAGINIVLNPTTLLALTNGLLTVNANVKVNGTITSTGNMAAGSIDLETHVHSGVTTGSSNTGGPTG